MFLLMKGNRTNEDSASLETLFGLSTLNIKIQQIRLTYFRLLLNFLYFFIIGFKQLQLFFTKDTTSFQKKPDWAYNSETAEKSPFFTSKL